MLDADTAVKKFLTRFYDNPLGSFKTIQKLIENYLAGKFSTSDFISVFKIKSTELSVLAYEIQEQIKLTKEPSGGFTNSWVNDDFVILEPWLKVYVKTYKEIVENPSKENVAKIYNGSLFRRGLKSIIQNTIQDLKRLRDDYLRFHKL